RGEARGHQPGVSARASVIATAPSHSQLKTFFEKSRRVSCRSYEGFGPKEAIDRRRSVLHEAPEFGLLHPELRPQNLPRGSHSRWLRPCRESRTSREPGR